jgi:hypothetical protein
MRVNTPPALAGSAAGGDSCPSVPPRLLVRSGRFRLLETGMFAPF